MGPVPYNPLVDNYLVTRVFPLYPTAQRPHPFNTGSYGDPIDAQNITGYYKKTLP